MRGRGMEGCCATCTATEGKEVRVGASGSAKVVEPDGILESNQYAY
jgi:hypothetical protein